MRAFCLGLSLTLSAMVSLGGCSDSRIPADREIDQQLNKTLNSLISTAKIMPDGTVRLSRAPGDPKLLEPYSGLYFLISGKDQKDLSSRSLWERKLKIRGPNDSTEPFVYNSDQFPNEPLRVIERTVRLPGSKTDWHFVVAGERKDLNRSDK